MSFQQTHLKTHKEASHHEQDYREKVKYIIKSEVVVKLESFNNQNTFQRTYNIITFWEDC